MQKKLQQQKQSQAKHSFSYRFGRMSVKSFARVLLIPGMHRLFKSTFLGACSHVKMLTQQGKYDQALNHLIGLLDSHKFKSKRTYRWWYLMRQAISITQDYELTGPVPTTDYITRLIHLTNHGPSPKSGYDAAYCFVGVALWAFQMGNSEQAVSYVHQAIVADNEWGYPEYLMGWLALFQEGVDPIPHFVNALKFNWSFFHRMNKDPICQQHPEVIRQVRQRVSMMTESQASSNQITH